MSNSCQMSFDKYFCKDVWNTVLSYLNVGSSDTMFLQYDRFDQIHDLNLVYETDNLNCLKWLYKKDSSVIFWNAQYIAIDSTENGQLEIITWLIQLRYDESYIENIVNSVTFCTVGRYFRNEIIVWLFEWLLENPHKMRKRKIATYLFNWLLSNRLDPAMNMLKGELAKLKLEIQ